MRQKDADWMLGVLSAALVARHGPDRGTVVEVIGDVARELRYANPDLDLTGWERLLPPVAVLRLPGRISEDDADRLREQVRAASERGWVRNTMVMPDDGRPGGRPLWEGPEAAFIHVVDVDDETDGPPSPTP